MSPQTIDKLKNREATSHHMNKYKCSIENVIHQVDYHNQLGLFENIFCHFLHWVAMLYSFCVWWHISQKTRIDRRKSGEGHRVLFFKIVTPNWKKKSPSICNIWDCITFMGGL